MSDDYDIESEPSASTDHSNIHTAMNAVMQEVRYVRKQKTDGLNYTYAGEAKIIDVVRASLVRHGIVMYPVSVDDLRSENYLTSQGKSMNRVISRFTFEFVHAPSGTSQRVMVIGEGADSGDKSANKSMTTAKKYALLQSLLLRTGDDPDETPSGDQERSSNGKTNVNTPHWSTNPKNVEKFESWCERGEITQNDMFACFGSMDIKDFPLTLRETEETLARFVAQGSS